MKPEDWSWLKKRWLEFGLMDDTVVADADAVAVAPGSGSVADVHAVAEGVAESGMKNMESSH